MANTKRPTTLPAGRKLTEIYQEELNINQERTNTTEEKEKKEEVRHLKEGHY